MHTHQNSSHPVATIGVDIGKNTYHLVGLDKVRHCSKLGNFCRGHLP